MYTTHRRRRGAPAPQRRRSFSSGAPRSGARPQQRQGRSNRRMPSFDPSQFINTNPIEVAAEAYVPQHTFAAFGLDARLAGAIAARGITAPTPIQDQIIPEILAGRDVIGLAETGTGKTAAFLVPLIQKTILEPRRRTLILTPTRELALQIEGELRMLTQGLHITSVVCVGGVNINPQIRSLKRQNNQFVIGTPGRVLDLMERKNFVPRDTTTVVLDEADRMLDMGFIKDMRTILGAVPKERETLFFSATMPEDAKRIVNDFLRDPAIVAVKKKDVAQSIEQDVVRYDERAKFDTLCDLLAQPEFSRVIVFGSMKHSVEKLARLLAAKGVKADSIHGNKSHGQRQRALQKFKNGEAHVLVATDVAARGIHVEDVSHVINYDLPNTFEDYVHRIGRTGRAEKRGKALTFVPNR